MRDVRLYLQDILDSIEIVESYVRGVPREEFFANQQLQDSAIRRLEIIGEAARHVDDDFRAAHPEIPWREVAGFRDVLIHGYFGIKLHRVWDVIQQDLPALKRSIESLLTPEPPKG
jgi:uncharacterized protein with HEPN domain